MGPGGSDATMAVEEEADGEEDDDEDDGEEEAEAEAEADVVRETDVVGVRSTSIVPPVVRRRSCSCERHPKCGCSSV